MRWHFLSYKFGRLLLPWAGLVALLSSWALPASPIKQLLLVSEAVLIGIILADRVIPGWFPLKRLTAPANSFVLMNLASMAAIVVFFMPPTKLWLPTQVKVPVSDSARDSI